MFTVDTIIVEGNRDWCRKAFRGQTGVTRHPTTCKDIKPIPNVEEIPTPIDGLSVLYNI